MNYARLRLAARFACLMNYARLRLAARFACPMNFARLQAQLAERSSFGLRAP
jgi:hypothetical protein